MVEWMCMYICISCWANSKLVKAINGKQQNQFQSKIFNMYVRIIYITKSPMAAYNPLTSTWKYGYILNCT